MPLPRVLVDATALRATTGFYGIGRFTFDLLQGLAGVASEWRNRLEIKAIDELSITGTFTVSEDLAGVAERAMAERGRASNAGLRRARRLWLARVAAREGAVLVHLPQPDATPLGVARVVTCHDLIPLRFARDYLGSRLLGHRASYVLQLARDARRYRGARRVVAISSRTRDDLEDLLGVPPDRIDVVPNGVDLARLSAKDEDGRDRARVEALGVRRPFVLYVGYCDPRKNMEGLFSAVARARREIDVDVVWAGKVSDDEARDAVRAAEERGLGAALHRVGFVDDATLSSLYRRAIAHVFLSRLEGFGLTVVEAMASGCPVIVAQGSASDEVAGDAGLVVDANDHAAAARGIVELSRVGEARAAQVTKGLERARRFSREATARGYVESYLRATR